MNTDPNDKHAFVTWSGGIDSTQVICTLLEAGFTVQPVALLFGKYEATKQREFNARELLQQEFLSRFPDTYRRCHIDDGSFLDSFEVPGVEQMPVPRRNHLILDFMMAKYVIPSSCYYLGMGTYIGSDTGVVDHVPAYDADTRYLQAYMLQEYGHHYQLLTCDTFGPRRYKGDRVEDIVRILGPEALMLTTNCGANTYYACGNCYNCAERNVAIEQVLQGFDDTKYLADPKQWPYYDNYVRQHAGEKVEKVPPTGGIEWGWIDSKEVPEHEC